MTCQKARQEFYDSKLLRLPSSTAKSGIAIPNSRDSAGLSKRFNHTKDDE